MVRQNNSFDGRFAVFIADTPESKQIFHRLSYQVYREAIDHEECRYVSHGHQRVEDDPRAVYFLVRHQRSGQWLGGLRMLVHQTLSFPHHVCSLSDWQPFGFSGGDNAEISSPWLVKGAKRVAIEWSIEPSAKRWQVDFFNEYANVNKTLMWGLYRAAAVYSAEHGVSNWHICLNPALAWCLSKEGFELEEITNPYDLENRFGAYRLMVDHFLDNPLWLHGYSNSPRGCSTLADEYALAFEGRQLRTIGMISFVSRV